jgi:hypothetical protein
MRKRNDCRTSDSAVAGDAPGHQKSARLVENRYHDDAMALLDSPDAARRLARAISADILLYPREEIAKGGDISEAIAEGRALFASRVAPANRGIFEETVPELPAGKSTTGVAVPFPSRHDDTTASQGRGHGLDIPLAIVAALLILGGMLLKKCN